LGRSLLLPSLIYLEGDMLSVILIWIYMIITIFPIGFCLKLLLNRLIGYENNEFIPTILIGLVGVTWYAQIFSLFGGVGLLSNIILCVASISIAIVFRKEFKATISNRMAFLYERKITFFIGIFLFVIMAYCASNGYIHYDTGLYHAQSIKWIEEYGVVFGLGNLHTRLAYNSAAFALNALYSFSFLGSQSFHVTAAFCALLLAFECLNLRQIFEDKCLHVSDFAIFMAIYYLLTIQDEFISPASDYYMVCLSFILVIRWIRLVENKKLDASGFAMLAFLAGFILTIKLSGALLILVAVIPIVQYIKQKDYKKIFLCLLIGLVIAIPYLIRNLILSGWLLYPSTFVGINVDWKIPVDIAISDYKEIQVYGRGFTDIAAYDLPITKWFPTWFAGRAMTDKLFIAAAIVGVGYFMIKCLYYGFTICKGKKTPEKMQELMIELVLCLCFIFWMCTSPLMRYGCLYVYLTAGVIWGRCLLGLLKNKVVLRVLYCLLILVAIYKAFTFGVETAKAATTDYLVCQKDYENFDVFTYELDGVTIYAPKEGDRVGYDAFPSSPWVMDKIGLRGTDIRKGFKATN